MKQRIEPMTKYRVFIDGKKQHCDSIDLCNSHQHWGRGIRLTTNFSGKNEAPLEAKRAVLKNRAKVKNTTLPDIKTS